MRTIQQVAPLIRDGQLTPMDLLHECWNAIDEHESRIRAWAFLDRESAQQQAVQLTEELRRGQYRGPLHGIPVGIKDIIDVFDWPTAAGSTEWQSAYARQDADCVRSLRQAGAVLLGKTVTTAYASFDPSPTRNPHDLTRTPGGSSSGSAAAVATGMCYAALASQTGGSITRPASYCGVWSLKPSWGAVSTNGVLPLAPSMDHIGVMARDVHDLAMVYQVIYQPMEMGYPALPDLLLAMEEGPAVTRLGRLRGFFDQHTDPEMQAAMDAFCDELRGDDWQIIDIGLPGSFAEVSARHRTIMAVEAAAYHQTRFERKPRDYPPRISELLREGIATSAPEYRHAQLHQGLLREAMATLFDDVGVLLTPATTGPAPDAATTGDPAYNSPWSYLGLPTVSFPIATSRDGLPLCAQLIGAADAEAEVLAVAARLVAE